MARAFHWREGWRYAHHVAADTLGLRALDALDAPEIDAVRAHLQLCPVCREHLVRMQRVTGQLALLASTPPPPRVKASLFAALPAQILSKPSATTQ